MLKTHGAAKISLIPRDLAKHGAGLFLSPSRTPWALRKQGLAVRLGIFLP